MLRANSKHRTHRRSRGRSPCSSHRSAGTALPPQSPSCCLPKNGRPWNICVAPERPNTARPCGPAPSYWRLRVGRMTPSPDTWNATIPGSANGDAGSPKNGWPGLRTARAVAAPGAFPPCSKRRSLDWPAPRPLRRVAPGSGGRCGLFMMRSSGAALWPGCTLRRCTAFWRPRPCTPITCATGVIAGPRL